MPAASRQRECQGQPGRNHMRCSSHRPPPRTEQRTVSSCDFRQPVELLRQAIGSLALERACSDVNRPSAWRQASGFPRFLEARLRSRLPACDSILNRSGFRQLDRNARRLHQQCQGCLLKQPRNRMCHPVSPHRNRRVLFYRVTCCASTLIRFRSRGASASRT